MDPSAINHIAINCRNLAAQEAFFSKHFGFQRSRTFKAGKPDEYIMLKLGSVRKLSWEVRAPALGARRYNLIVPRSKFGWIQK
jgi:catechol 2,3-dioxygenase-like lactoylglutathione lyase family enzyme